MQEEITDKFIDELHQLVRSSLHDKLQFSIYKKRVKTVAVLLTLRAHIRALKSEPESNRYFLTAMRQAESSMSKLDAEDITEGLILRMAKRIHKMIEELPYADRKTIPHQEEIRQLVDEEIDCIAFCRNF